MAKTFSSFVSSILTYHYKYKVRQIYLKFFAFVMSSRSCLSLIINIRYHLLHFTVIIKFVHLLEYSFCFSFSVNIHHVTLFIYFYVHPSTRTIVSSLSQTEKNLSWEVNNNHNNSKELINLSFTLLQLQKYNRNRRIVACSSFPRSFCIKK